MTRFHQKDTGELVPFIEEEEAQWDAMVQKEAAEQAALAATEYQRQRAAEYPPMADYIEAL